MLLVLHIFSSELPGSPNPLCSLLFPAVYPGRMTMMCSWLDWASGEHCVRLPWGCYAWAAFWEPGATAPARRSLPYVCWVSGFLYFLFIAHQPGDSCDVRGNELLLLFSWCWTSLASPRSCLYTLVAHLQRCLLFNSLQLPICSLPGP